MRDAAADLVVSFMVLQDVDDLDGTLAETGRVFEPGGHLCFSVLHPLEVYFNALARSGFVVERLREPVPDDALVDGDPLRLLQRRIPSLLHVRARLDA